MKRGHSRL
ncbi:unnamed protein product [Callosobruchus maculatus]|uniref:Uncharacterized protein n=1 Tax=Callosobruchus maculatus TaxID=64391 RepID=A0A653C6M1_CALMS|nr:unnamed protein product [Callosobruchus maculatus]